MSLIRVIGIGSLFGDDQIGWEIVRLLKKRERISKIPADILTVSCCYHPGELLELMQGASYVFLIDAIKSFHLPIGQISRLEKEEIVTAMDGGLSTHELGVASILQLGETLDILPEKIVLYGIEIGDDDGINRINPLLKVFSVKLLKKLEKEVLSLVEFL